MVDFATLPEVKETAEEVVKKSLGELIKQYRLPIASAGIGFFGLLALKALVFRKKSVKLSSLSGKWAIITSATDPLGKAMAIELARNGINLILISKIRWHVEPLEEQIRNLFPVEVVALAIDFVNDSEYHYSKMISENIEGKEIDLLINNVEILPEFNKFLDYKNGSSDVSHKVIKCNIGSVNHMISVVLPKMVNQNRGIILNIGSLSGLIPTPLSALFSATKAYVNFLSECLNAEYKDKGIIVQCLNPGHIYNENSVRHPKPSLHYPTPETYVRSAFRKIGCGNGYAGYWPHDMQRIVSGILPAMFVRNKIIKDHGKEIDNHAPPPPPPPATETEKDEKFDEQ